jgi:hypothetical protein
MCGWPRGSAFGHTILRAWVGPRVKRRWSYAVGELTAREMLLCAVTVLDTNRDGKQRGF